MLMRRTRSRILVEHERDILIGTETRSVVCRWSVSEVVVWPCKSFKRKAVVNIHSITHVFEGYLDYLHLLPTKASSAAGSTTDSPWALLFLWEWPYYYCSPSKTECVKCVIARELKVVR